MTLVEVKKNTEQRMQKSLEALKADLAKVRTGRAHTGILDHVQVEYYGNPTLLSQVANVTLIDARTIGVQPWEKKMLSAIEKAIRDSDLGLNPSSQGDMIRVPTPQMGIPRFMQTQTAQTIASMGIVASATLQMALLISLLARSPAPTISPAQTTYTSGIPALDQTPT